MLHNYVYGEYWTATLDDDLLTEADLTGGELGFHGGKIKCSVVLLNGILS